MNLISSFSALLLPVELVGGSEIEGIAGLVRLLGRALGEGQRDELGEEVP